MGRSAENKAYGCGSDPDSTPCVRMRGMMGMKNSLIGIRVDHRQYGLIVVKSSSPAIRKMTVRMVENPVQPLALRLVTWNRPLIASSDPLVRRDRAHAMMPFGWFPIMLATDRIGSTFDHRTLTHQWLV